MFKLVTSNFLLLGLLVSCAKEKSYDKVYKEIETLKKTQVQTHEELTVDGKKTLVPVKYLYVPMTLGTPREVKVANPFYQGDEKVVRLQWTKKGLEVLELEKDGRFTGNHLNDTPVLTIPGEFKSYQCKEDEYGDCTGEEEVNEDLAEESRDYFLPSYDELTVEEVNMLDLANVEGEACVTNIGTKVVDYEISSGVVNIELEKTYKLNNKSFSCIWENYVEDKLSYNSFKVRFFYSMVRLDKLTTPGFEPIKYPIQDHDKFGFFKTQTDVLDDNFDPNRKDENFLVNRWSPKRKNGELVYYLSKTFNKPKNKVFLDATYKAVGILNQGLVEANSPFQVKLIKQDDDKKGISPGDLRYSSIVLVDDPLANGLLGYGPSVTNPYTGEIVQAHTNMYGGVLTSTVRRVYEAAVDLTEDAIKKPAQKSLNLYTVKKEAYSELPQTLIKDMLDESGMTLTEDAPAEVTGAQILESQISLSAQSRSKLAQIPQSYVLRTIKDRVQTKFDYKAEYVRLSQNNFEGMDAIEIEDYKRESQKLGFNHTRDCHPEFFPIGGTQKVVYPGLLKIAGAMTEKGTLKRWTELNKKQQEQVRVVILESSYVSTFIHEIGHNLGLRHNFQGSFDKDNFYSDEEAQKFGMTKAPAYSSVMDYSFSEYNELKALGKYDIAALRFAYAREVEKADGSIIKIESPVHQIEGLREFAFCTDENAGLSALCNRFDEGTNLVEIANFRAKRYNDAYKYRNFRDGKLDFSAYDLGGYLSSRNSEFKDMRMIFEEYERFADLFSPELMAQGCGPSDLAKYPVCKMINERRDAVKIVGKFFVDILKTPDHICAVANKDDLFTVTEFQNLEALYDAVKYDIDYVPTSCFDEAITKNLEEKDLVAVAENGKFLNSFKDTNPRYKYVTDRAVLGVWGDKVLAMKNLFLRRGTERTTDKNFMALIDISFMQPEVGNVLNHYTLGTNLSEPIPFKTANGDEVSLPYVIGNEYKIEQLEDGFAPFKNFLGLDEGGRTNLIKASLAQITNVGVAYGIDYEEQAYQLGNFASVKKFPYLSENQETSGLQFFDGRFFYEASKENVIAAQFIGTINAKELLDKAGEKIVAKVLEHRVNPAAPTDLSEEEAAFFMISEATGLQGQLIKLKTQGSVVPEAVFSQAFGAEAGPLIFALYSSDNALERMKSLVSLKDTVSKTPAEDASEIEKSLFGIELNILAMYTRGEVTTELVEYYKLQLKKLPKHMYLQ